jgi:nucleoside 2-deoxyribosyltransferase
MPTEDLCPLCGESVKIWNYDRNFRRAYECENCGRFYLWSPLDNDIDYFKQNSSFYKLSSWVFEQNNSFNHVPEIDEKKLKEILAQPDKKIRQKFDLMLQTISKLNEWKTKYIQTRSWIKDEEELALLFQKALDENMINGNLKKTLNGSYVFTFNGLTFDGKEYLESLQEPNITSKSVFVAFHFEDTIKEIFDNKVKEAVENCGLEYRRVSSMTTDLDKNINDEIIGFIKSARLVIADFTNQRNSVYFEAGYAMGMGLPVIWTCKKDDVKKLAFDIRQYPVILWSGGQELKEKLSQRIKAIL